ncbi:MAG: NACHT domain-containing protein [Anaerolineae bacterium]
MTTKTPDLTDSPQIKTLDEWRQFVIQHWDALKRQSEQAGITAPYTQLMYIALVPVLPHNKKHLKDLVRLLKDIRYCEPLGKLLEQIYNKQGFDIAPKELVEQHLALTDLDDDQHIGVDWLLVSTGTLFGLKARTTATKTFLGRLEQDLKKQESPSAVRVQAGMLSAGQNMVFAGGDATVITQYYRGDKAALRAYLSAVRTEWALPTTSIHPRAMAQTRLALHELFIPHDTWVDTTEYADSNLQQLNQRRFHAIDINIDDGRQSVLEMIATNPFIVITGGAGTGKTSLCHFVAIALAYACDPKAEKDEGVNGLALLSPAWIHGALLPLFVSLRDFCNSADFPTSTVKATASSLIQYLKQQTGDFAPHLEAFLTQVDVDTHGTLLILDGLDEIYDEKQRMILRRVIENWADRFKLARIILTSRTYAYRHDARWRLSSRFKSFELAPFNWRQMRRYIERWYLHAAKARPGAFGGRAFAENQARLMAKDLISTILENTALWPLARQPLMLTLLTLIHEDYKKLPDKRAELYEQTIELLDRWNIPSPADKLHEKLSQINLKRMRAALKSIAFELQSQQKTYQRYPTSIDRGTLLEKLMQQNLNSEGLGAKIEDVLEYLATRNGILVADEPGKYRFPHLTVQEYLAACALIEFYDECKMPDGLQPAETSDGWTFPENIAALLRDDPYRWRQVALFAGSIIAASKGQDLRWQLIDELLPIVFNERMDESELYCIGIASEIWSESWLKARTRSQRDICQHLKHCLQAIQNDERLDAPERTRNIMVLAKLELDL